MSEPLGIPTPTLLLISNATADEAEVALRVPVYVPDKSVVSNTTIAAKRRRAPPWFDQANIGFGSHDAASTDAEAGIAEDIGNLASSFVTQESEANVR
jgi:hypothetical protein